MDTLCTFYSLEIVKLEKYPALKSSKTKIKKQKMMIKEAHETGYL